MQKPHPLALGNIYINIFNQKKAQGKTMATEAISSLDHKIFIDLTDYFL
jgi:hypothetical protein